MVPGASSTEIVGWLDDELKVRVSAVPEKGRANVAVIKLLAKALGISKSDINLMSGLTSRHKVFEINSLEEAKLVALKCTL